MHYVTLTIVASSECTQIKASLVCHKCFTAGHMNFHSKLAPPRSVSSYGSWAIATSVSSKNLEQLFPWASTTPEAVNFNIIHLLYT